MAVHRERGSRGLSEAPCPRRHARNGAVIARCSQPEISWWGWRNADDEYLVTSIAKACALNPGARPSGAAPHAGSSDGSEPCDADFGEMAPASPPEWGITEGLPGCPRTGLYPAVPSCRDCGVWVALWAHSRWHWSGRRRGGREVPGAQSLCVPADSSLTACSGVENAGTPQKLLILDARSYTAAVANRAKGGGCECEGTEGQEHSEHLLLGPGSGS